LVHCGLAYFIVSGSPVSVTQKRSEEKRYSVLLIRPEDFRLPRRPEEKAEKQASPGRSSTASPRYGAPAESQAAAAAESAPDSAPANSQPKLYRPFVPPTRRVDPVKQTLVQPDVPPDIHLPRDLALPTLIVWTPALPKLRKSFVMPAPAKPVKTSVDVPAAPDLSPPNMESTIADLKLAATLPKNNPRFFRPPASTAPIKSAGPQLASSAPLILPRSVGDAPATSLLSLPDMPARSAELIAIPPANQVAASGGAGSGHANATGAAGTGSAGQTGGQTGGQHSGRASDGRASEGRASDGRASDGRASDDVSASGRANGFTGSSGSSDKRLPGVADGADDGVGAGVLPLPGTIKIELPKEGKFGVVVSGSSAAAPYAESVGALSGRMIYSVYLKVGLRKNWILQYCLPRSEEQKTAIRGRPDPLEAPWPYFIVRPSAISMDGANADYILIHGTLTAGGRFDKLAMVFPGEFKQKDLLMRSLQQWTFRPASRDGVAADVEVLLIIPNSPE
jgi:hypothetical protein